MDRHVVVVGGGLSGLYAANLLSKRNIPVTVLEASSLLGGRIKGIELASGGRIDLGGQWVSSRHTRIQTLLKEAGANLYPNYFSGKNMLMRGGRVQAYSQDRLPLSFLERFDIRVNIIRRTERLIKALDANGGKLAEELDKINVEAWMQQHLWTSAARQLLAFMVRNEFGAEPCEVSMFFFLFEVKHSGGLVHMLEIVDGAHEFKIDRLAYSMIEHLASTLPQERIHTNSPVLRIEAPTPASRHQEIVIHCGVGLQQKIVRARYVILAIPPTQLAQIEFVPDVPASHSQLWRRSIMGTYIKIIIVYETRFWRDRGLSGQLITLDEDSILTWVMDGCDQSPSQLNALVVFVAGHHARLYSRLSPDASKNRVLAELALAFGAEALEPLEYVEVDWTAVPYVRGGPDTFFGPGAAREYDFLERMQRPWGRLHFAGTETTCVDRGYMEGAVESGERAAREVIECIAQGGVSWDALRPPNGTAAAPAPVNDTVIPTLKRVEGPSEFESTRTFNWFRFARPCFPSPGWTVLVSALLALAVAMLVAFSVDASSLSNVTDGWARVAALLEDWAREGSERSLRTLDPAWANLKHTLQAWLWGDETAAIIS
ncbi:uncharacterized protein VTP21DRAFT_10187 [Calcarisporiella thermophila]|uniref:uncharacterized protein n=1 Tax=Calcarisporiella thermophila TaxID=911321 RepID=UPI00374411CD